MTAASGTPLGQLIEAKKRLKRVSWTHVYTHAGIASNTLDALRKGQTGEPDVKTLRAIGRAFATEPDPPYEVDDQEAQQHFVDLFIAADYGLDEVPSGADLLGAALFLASGSRQKVAPLRAVIGRLVGRSVDEIERFARGIPETEI